MFTDFARSALDGKPHAAVITAEAYREYLPPGMGDSHSESSPLIVVLRLADGSARAFDVQCGIDRHPKECQLLSPQQAP